MKPVASMTVAAISLILCITEGASAQATKVATKKATVSQSALRKEAKIREKDARKTALAEVPGGKVKAHELEREGGKLIYSYDIAVPGKPGVEEVHVNAMTGEMIKHEHEDAKTEAREKRAEAKEAKKKP